MKNLMVAGFSAISLCGFVAMANAAPLNSTVPVHVAAVHVMAQQPGNLQSQTPQREADARYIFDVVPEPNADGAPIPSGG